MTELDYVGVRSCGCITAWLSSDHVTQAEVRDFYRSMADTGREVRRMTLTEARATDAAFLPAECPHGGDRSSERPADTPARDAGDAESHGKRHSDG